jgi:hypothetical protein
MDRTPYHLPFTVDRVPFWHCPLCGVGRLTLDAKNLVINETAQSIHDRQHAEWEPDWIRYVYSCIFTCSNSSCRSVVSSCGTGKTTLVEDEDEEFGLVQSTEDAFFPKYFEPSLRLLDIPDKTHLDACIHLQEASALYFADSGAAMNSARAAIEVVVTDLGAKRFTLVGGKRKPINLHQRILALPQKYTGVIDLLLAIKWLGNAGSHDGKAVDSGDLRVTFDLLEHALSEVYEAKATALKAIAKKVNKKKGPIKK